LPTDEYHASPTLPASAPATDPESGTDRD